MLGSHLGLLSYHSKGFPLEKATAYAKLRLPYVINDLERQYDLLDRSSLLLFAYFMKSLSPFPLH